MSKSTALWTFPARCRYQTISPMNCMRWWNILEISEVDITVPQSDLRMMGDGTASMIRVSQSFTPSHSSRIKLRMPAAGTQVFRPTCETQDQSPAERREREEDEGTAEEGKDPAATAFINRDEGRGIKDKARVMS